MGFKQTARSMLLAVMGPTASGKSAVAAEISRRIPSEMIACDSMQVYRHMPIVAQTPADTHLAGFLEPDREYSADEFRKDADSLIQKIWKNKKIPILTGGTGLYLRALLDGLFAPEEGMPIKDLKLRDKFLEEVEVHGAEFLHTKLAKVDPESAKKIHTNDVRRVVRALEIFKLTGKPFSQQKQNRSGLRALADCRVFVLERERKDLYRRIDARVEKMIELGLIEEVRTLLKIKLSRTAAGALGIREIEGFLKKQTGLKEAVVLLQKNTRNYAKRQLSWFRNDSENILIPVGDKDSVAQIADQILNRCKDVI